jgi:DNA-directed RNA polymerase subunit RPC12/RpoP
VRENVAKHGIKKADITPRATFSGVALLSAGVPLKQVISATLRKGLPEAQWKLAREGIKTVVSNKKGISKKEVTDFEAITTDFEAITDEENKDSRSDNDHQHNGPSACPRCGSKTVVRKARKTGRRFLGCFDFPRCRWTQNLASNEKGE